MNEVIFRFQSGISITCNTIYTKGKVVCKNRTRIQAGLIPIFLANHFFLSISSIMQTIIKDYERKRV